MLVQEWIDCVGVYREFLCELCGMRYRGKWDEGCPFCKNGDPDQPEAHYRGWGSLGTRAEQREQAKEAMRLYQELGSTRAVAHKLGWTLQRVQHTLRRERKRGLL